MNTTTTVVERKKPSIAVRATAPREGVESLVELVRAAAVRGTIARGRRRYPLRRADVIIAAMLFVAALAIRWPFIARGHTLLHSDEAIVGIMSQDIASAARFPMFFYGQRYMGALEAYVIAALRPFCGDPIVALRLGPACFFAALVVLQYLMLTRWFGRRGGFIGACALLAASPMFVQWSISARGGYIEVLVWGTALWWAYSEWFASGSERAAAPRGVHKFLLGALIGSGLWINPSIAVFIVPMAVHALLGCVRSEEQPGFLDKVDRMYPNLPLAFPVCVMVALAVMTSIWSVWVEQGQVHHLILMDLLPRPAALGVLAVFGAAGAALLVRWGGIAALRRWIQSSGSFILGALAGLAPMLVYVVQRTVAGQAMEASLPLGLRPIGTIGESVRYFYEGLPLLLGADARPFLDLVRVGRAYPIAPLSDLTGAAVGRMNLLVLGALMAIAIVLLRQYGREIGDAFRLKRGPHSPVALLVLGFLAIVSMYCMGACTIDFTTVRYLLPLWAVIPGLIAAVAVSRRDRAPATASVGILLAAWGAGQIAYCAQLGPSHPLEHVAQSLRSGHDEFALAEPLDAHLLSFLTGQRPRIGEFQSFWPRLAHFRAGLDPKGPMTYLVDTTDRDWTLDWTRAGWPGDPPPETSRYLWPLVKRAMSEHPDEVVSRERLVDGYELIRLAHAIPERSNLH